MKDVSLMTPFPIDMLLLNFHMHSRSTQGTWGQQWQFGRLCCPFVRCDKLWCFHDNSRRSISSIRRHLWREWKINRWCTRNSKKSLHLKLETNTVTVGQGMLVWLTSFPESLFFFVFPMIMCFKNWISLNVWPFLHYCDWKLPSFTLEESILISFLFCLFMKVRSK